MPSRNNKTKLTVKGLTPRQKLAAFEARQKHSFLPEINEGYVTEDQIVRLQELIKEDSSIRRILEVGFNGGNSVATMLSVRNSIEVVSFDIGTHTYIAKAKKLIDAMFPARHTLVIGNSTKTIPEYFKNNKNHIFDAAFIDGGHHGNVPYLDIMNVCKLVKPGGLIVIDDLSYAPVLAAIIRALGEYIIVFNNPAPPNLSRPWFEARRMLCCVETGKSRIKK
jgi:predicted O-methyltransferase YrrM